MGLDNILDMQDFFINEVAGTLPIFIFLSLLVIMILSAQARFPNIVTFAIITVYMLIIGAFYQSVLAVIGFVIGSFIAWSLVRLISGNK